MPHSRNAGLTALNSSQKKSTRPVVFLTWWRSSSRTGRSRPPSRPTSRTGGRSTRAPTFSVGGGPPQTGEHMLKVGTYNAIIESNQFYCPAHNDFEQSHKTFKRMMPTFAWEVLEVYSGPPTVAFGWRHWGTFKEDYSAFSP